MQGSLSKRFPIKAERVHAELKASGYNLTNRLNRANPDLGITCSSSASLSANLVA